MDKNRLQKWTQTQEEESQMIHEQIPNWTPRQVRRAHKCMIPIIRKALESSLATVRLLDELVPSSMPSLTPEPIKVDQDLFYFRGRPIKGQ